MPLASARSAGSKVEFAGRTLEVRELTDESIQGLDLILSSAGGKVSSEWAPRWIEAGAVVVDNTSFWRMHEDVPLVVAQVNDDAVADHNGLVANPNCTTMQLMVALKPILDAAGIERLIVSTYQSVSGTGREAIEELRDSPRRCSRRAGSARPRSIRTRSPSTCCPQVETFKDGDDYTTEERKLMAETRKILGLSEDVGISATCVRVPVVIGHSESVNVQTARISLRRTAASCSRRSRAWSSSTIRATAIYPMAIAAAGRDEVLVGRIRRDPSHERCLNLWVVGDNLRKGAATNAVQVAELLHQRDLVRVPAGASLS